MIKLGKQKQNTDGSGPVNVRPAITPEAEDSQMIALATRLAKERLLNGTASSQEIVFFLKQGSEQAKLERDRLIEENKLLKAKTEALEREARSETDYGEVIRALKRYRGEEEEVDYGDVCIYEPGSNIY